MDGSMMFSFAFGGFRLVMEVLIGGGVENYLSGSMFN